MCTCRHVVRRGLSEAGYTEGQTVTIGLGIPDRLIAIADEVIE